MITKRKTRPVASATTERTTSSLHRTNTNGRLFKYRPTSRLAGGSVTELKVHPAADWLPELPANEYEELKADIQNRGLREPILVKHGFIMDGRHRYRACQELDIEPETEQYEGSDVIEEIASRNLFRRNLTPKQRAELVVKMLGNKLKADARERQTAGLKKGEASPVLSKVDRTGTTREQVARIAVVSRRTAEAALRGDTKRKHKPKPPVDKLADEFIWKRFSQFLKKHWPSPAHQRTVREYLAKKLA